MKMFQRLCKVLINFFLFRPGSKVVYDSEDSTQRCKDAKKIEMTDTLFILAAAS